MPTYHIEDGQMETFTKRINSINRKLRKTGDACTCKEVGIEYKKLEDGNTYKFHIMEVQGVVSFEGWNYVAKIEHLNSGNIVTAVNDTEIPQEYWHTKGYCDHCKTDRVRKTTYLFEKDGVFHQLGKSCVSLYTEGLDIRRVDYISDVVRSFEEGERDYDDCCFLDGFIPYYIVKEILCYASAIIGKFGYAKKYDEEGTFNPNSTYMRVLRAIKEHKEDVSMYANKAEEIISWVKNYDGINSYLNNVKVIIEEGYITDDKFPLLISVISYLRSHNTEEVNNSFIGKVGDKVDLKLKEVTLVYSSNTVFGTLYTYKAIDEDDHVLITYTSRFITNLNNCHRWVGTIKEHSEYNDIKQTVLSRVKFMEDEE